MTKISDETNIERIEHKSKKNMALGAIFGYLSILVSVVHGFVLTPMIMDSVGVDEYGLFGIATSIITLFLLDFGLTTTTETYLAKLRAKGDKDGVQKFLASIFKIYVTLDIIFIVIIGAIYFLSPIIYRGSYTPEQIQKLQYLLLIIGGYTLVSFPTNTFSSMIQTYEKFGFNKFTDLIQKALYLAFTVVAIEFNWGIVGITIVNVVSFTIAIVMRFFYMRFYLGIKLDLRLKIEKTELKAVIAFSAWGLIIAIGNRLVFNITPSILGIVSSADQVSMFMLINTIEGYVYLFGAMTGTFFMAKVARVESTGTVEEKRQRLQALANKVGKLQFFVIAFIIFGFASVGQDFIHIWIPNQLSYNPDFINIYWCILAICAYELVHIPELPLYNAMLTEGHIRPLAISTIIKAVVNVGLSFTLSSFFGAVGACAAIAAARVIDCTITNIAYKKYLGVSLLNFFGFIYIRGFITVALSFGLALICHFFLPINNLYLKFFVEGVAFVLSYIVLAFTVLFTKTERKYYLDVLFEILHIKKKAKPQNEQA